MTSRRQFIQAMVPLSTALLLTSCQTSKPLVQTAAAARFTSTGATVLDANEKTTQIHIKCPRCGYTTEMEIATPTADASYGQEWKCPRCGRRVKIIVELAKTPPQK